MLEKPSNVRCSSSRDLVAVAVAVAITMTIPTVRMRSAGDAVIPGSSGSGADVLGLGVDAQLTVSIVVVHLIFVKSDHK